MKQFINYIKGIFLAVKGQFPFEELKKLDNLTRQIERDNLSADDSVAKMFVARYKKLLSVKWRQATVVSMRSINRKLKENHFPDHQPVTSFEKSQKEADFFERNPLFHPNFKGWLNDDEHSYH